MRNQDKVVSGGSYGSREDYNGRPSAIYRSKHCNGRLQACVDRQKSQQSMCNQQSLPTVLVWGVYIVACTREYC